MQRRRFLSASALLGTTSVLPLAQTWAAAAEGPRFRLLRAESAAPGARFVASVEAPCVACASPMLEIEIDAMHLADHGAVLEDFALHAVHQLDDGSSAAFIAWQYAAGPVASRTSSARFVAHRAGLRRFELDYRLAGSGSRRESLALAGFELPLSPGHYVLLGPRRDGSRVRAIDLRHSGDRAAPLRGARDFDYLALRMHAMA